LIGILKEFELLLAHRKAAKNAKVPYSLLFADPRGIGFAFHRAGTPKSKMTQPFG
jgi:hypothetical protein